ALIDAIGPVLFEDLRDGEIITLDGATVLREGTWIGEGIVQDQATIDTSQEIAREGLSEQLEKFAENTMEYMLRERDLLLDGIGAPGIRTNLAGRPVLIVVRGYHYKEDLATLRPFLRENRPVIIGVDGGADAVLDAGFRPDMIISDMDSVSDRTLRSGAAGICTTLAGRPVLTVVRAYHYKEDLATLRPFLRENRPVIIGVDGGADAVLDAGFRPDMIIGDMDSVSDRALRSGAELVVH